MQRRSILHGRDVIESGARWRIGDGRSVKIWQHRWLPIKHPTLITSAPLESLDDATLDLLIDTTTRTWNAEMIEGIFTPTEAEQILRIPLARQQCADELYWPFTQSGSYTTKSGYRFLKEVHDGVEGSNDQYAEGVWRRIWALRVPNKVKHFVWRACKNSIPTKVNLEWRSIAVSSTCERCCREDETVVHALWSCRELNSVWLESGQWNCRRTNNF